MKAFLVSFLIIILLSCQSRHKPNSLDVQFRLESQPDSAGSKSQEKMSLTNQDNLTFLDSVSKRYGLSFDQIRNHTAIDSIYNTGFRSNASFTGDTVINGPNGIKGVILEYSDEQSCRYKFLVIMNAKSSHMISNMIVYTDCDQDEGAPYTTLNYKLINDSLFQTIETNFSIGSKDSNVQKTEWKIRADGKIDSL
jgi:hypothetical protein